MVQDGVRGGGGSGGDGHPACVRGACRHLCRGGFQHPGRGLVGAYRVSDMEWWLCKYADMYRGNGMMVEYDESMLCAQRIAREI